MGRLMVLVLGSLLLLVLVSALLPVAAAEDGSTANEDRWGPISTPMPSDAVRAFEAAVVGYASLRGQVVEPLEKVGWVGPCARWGCRAHLQHPRHPFLPVFHTQAIALAPSYLMAHIYLGSILLLSTGITKDHPLVQRSYVAARDLVRSLGPALTDREAGHFQALVALHEAGPTPDFVAAAQAWEAVLDGHPRDLLAVRSAHDAYIILGDTANLRASLA